MIRGRISDIDGLSDALSALQAAIGSSPGSGSGGGVVVEGIKIQYGTVVADIAGTYIPFETAYADDSYYFECNGQLNGGKVIVTYGNTDDGTLVASGCTVYPEEDGTTVRWIAVGGVA